MTAQDKDRLNRICDRAAQEIARRIALIRNFQEVPLGKTELTPAQFQATYGLGLSEVKRLREQYGDVGIAQALEAIRQMKGGQGNA